MAVLYALALAWAVPCAFAAVIPPDGGLQLKMQWFGADGHLVQMDWKTSAQWVWKESATALVPMPALQISAKLPPQIHVIGSQTPGIHLSEDRQKLVLNAEGSTVTGQLLVRSSSGQASEKAGVLFSVQAMAPQLLLHESCARVGLKGRLSPSGEGMALPTGLVYLGVRCVMDGAMIALHFSTAPEHQALSSTLRLARGGRARVALAPKGDAAQTLYAYVLEMGAGP